MSICPKNKSSKARRDKRRANWKMSAPNLVKCSKCGEDVYKRQGQGMQTMINRYEVYETNQMIEQENLDVRTITLGISLLDCIEIGRAHV